MRVPGALRGERILLVYVDFEGAARNVPEQLLAVVAGLLGRVDVVRHPAGVRVGRCRERRGRSGREDDGAQRLANVMPYREDGERWMGNEVRK